MADRTYLERLTRELTDKGKLIEAGWIALRLAAIPLDAPADQLDEMRNMFFAGARHLFSSIMVFLEPGAEPTDKDLERFDRIEDELREFIRQFELRIKTTGSA